MKWLSLLPIIPALLSCLASGTILYMVYKTGFNSPYKRILFGLSCSDIITSLAFALQPFLLPRETSQRVWAFGNDATCTFLGTITQLGMCSLLYNAFLAIYFLMIIRFRVHEINFAKYYEKYLHAFCIVWSTSTALVGAGMGAYREVELGPGCWVADYPEGCSDDTFECTSPMIAWIFSGIWVILTLVLVVVVNFSISRHVRRQLQRGSVRSSDPSIQIQRTRMVAVQASLYIAAFWACFIWTVILRIMESQNFDAEDEAAIFPVLVLQAVFVPLTGVFNLLVFLRPRYLQTRSTFPEATRFWALRRAMYGETIQEDDSTSRNASSRSSRRLFSIRPMLKLQQGATDRSIMLDGEVERNKEGNDGKEERNESSDVKEEPLAKVEDE